MRGGEPSMLNGIQNLQTFEQRHEGAFGCFFRVILWVYTIDALIDAVLLYQQFYFIPIYSHGIFCISLWSLILNFYMSLPEKKKCVCVYVCPEKYSHINKNT